MARKAVWGLHWRTFCGRGALEGGGTGWWWLEERECFIGFLAAISRSLPRLVCNERDNCESSCLWLMVTVVQMEEEEEGLTSRRADDASTDDTATIKHRRMINIQRFHVHHNSKLRLRKYFFFLLDQLQNLFKERQEIPNVVRAR